MVRRAGLECRGHQYVNVWSDLKCSSAGHVLDDQKVGAKWKVGSVLLGRANGQDRQSAGGAAGSFAASDFVQEEPGSTAGFARVTERHVPP